MPLSEPAERELLHARDIAIRGYARADGLIDVEAHMTDTKTYAFDKSRSRHGAARRAAAWHVAADHGRYLAPHHRMRGARWTTRRTRSAREPRRISRRLAGLSIKPGFLREAGLRVGGAQGCTHLARAAATGGDRRVPDPALGAHPRRQRRNGAQGHGLAHEHVPRLRVRRSAGPRTLARPLYRLRTRAGLTRPARVCLLSGRRSGGAGGERDRPARQRAVTGLRVTLLRGRLAEVVEDVHAHRARPAAGMLSCSIRRISSPMPMRSRWQISCKASQISGSNRMLVRPRPATMLRLTSLLLISLSNLG